MKLRMKRILTTAVMCVLGGIIHLLDTQQHLVGLNNNNTQLQRTKMASACILTTNSSIMQRDISFYEERFNTTHPLVLTMANIAQLELMHIWINVPHRNYQQFLVLALDEDTAKECCKKNIPYLYNSNLSVGGGNDMLFGSEQFLRLGYSKFSALKSIAIAGYSILFSEIDVFELIDPLGGKKLCKSKTQNQGCLTNSRHFDLEIQPNIWPGQVATNKELNIGFFQLQPSESSIFLLDEILKCLESNCGWDQEVFTSNVWKIQCCVVDDNNNARDVITTKSCATDNENCLRMRVLSAHYFPTGGKRRNFGIVHPDHYIKTKTCPTLVHCTGRTGINAKMHCIKRIEMLYGNCTDGKGVKPEYYTP